MRSSGASDLDATSEAVLKIGGACALPLRFMLPTTGFEMSVFLGNFRIRWGDAGSDVLLLLVTFVFLSTAIQSSELLLLLLQRFPKLLKETLQPEDPDSERPDPAAVTGSAEAWTPFCGCRLTTRTRSGD